MENKCNEATALRPQGDRLIDSPLVKIDIPSFMQILRVEKNWDEKDRNAITVFKTADMCIVLMALHEGAEISRHATDGMVNIQVLTGRIVIHTDANSEDLEQGQILTLHKNIFHSVQAVEESFFLLTLTGLTENNTANKREKDKTNRTEKHSSL